MFVFLSNQRLQKEYLMFPWSPEVTRKNVGGFIILRYYIKFYIMSDQIVYFSGPQFPVCKIRK